MPEVCAMLVMDLVRRLPHRIADVLTDHHRHSPCLDIGQFRCINRRRYHAIAVCDDVSVLDINMSQPLPVSSSDLEASQCSQCTGYQHEASLLRTKVAGAGYRCSRVSKHAFAAFMCPARNAVCTMDMGSYAHLRKRCCGLPLPSNSRIAT